MVVVVVVVVDPVVTRVVSRISGMKLVTTFVIICQGVAIDLEEYSHVTWGLVIER